MLTDRYVHQPVGSSGADHEGTHHGEPIRCCARHQVGVENVEAVDLPVDTGGVGNITGDRLARVEPPVNAAAMTAAIRRTTPATVFRECLVSAGSCRVEVLVPTEWT
jgi:hypothetical protein